MPDTVEQMLASLLVSDFDTVRGPDVLRQICEDLARHESPRNLYPAIFAFAERMGDVDLGSPGPIVHTLEALGGYESLLLQSVNRKPTSLTLWMINRLLNASQSVDVRRAYLAALEASLGHTAATSSVRDDAALFLEHQCGV